MKQLVLTLILIITYSTVKAQSKEFSEEQITQIEEQLTIYNDKLNLSDEQKPKFEEITKRYAGQMLELKNSDKGRMTKFKEFKSIRSSKNAEMKKLLTEEQYAEFEAIQEEIQQNLRNR